MLKIGVFGAGHLGKTHLHIANNSKMFDLVGFYETSNDIISDLLREYKYRSFESPEELIKAVDAICIATPTQAHFKIAEKAIKFKKHVFIEKPISKTDEEAAKLVQLAIENGVIGQVGHVERFNPAYQAVEPFLTEPMFIESHRLAEFNPRGTDVSVILDLMIHDIDIALSLVNSPIKHIDATGVAVISQTPDISNARITFENGCVANLTASRISLKKMRKTRFFQKNTYISVDYLFRKVEVVKIKNVSKNIEDLSILLTNAEGKKKQVYFENPKINENNAIKMEIEHFGHCIKMGKTPIISFKEGANALRVAHEIIKCIG